MFDASVPQIDRQVARCLKQKGIAYLPGTDVICYNSMIFNEELEALKSLGPASRVIFTSSGGNMYIARKMNRELSQRGVPVTIAGPCLSSCAMLILPGLQSIHIHNTAHIAVHGIVGLSFERWWGWNKHDARPSFTLKASAALGGNDDFMFYDSAAIHMRRHLDYVQIDRGYIEDISRKMETDARSYPGCRIDPAEYWTIVPPQHLRAYLGKSIVRMERFVSAWSDPLNIPYHHIGVPISNQTYIMKADFQAGNCLNPGRSSGVQLMAAN